jgi:hypothetical protein
MTQFEITEHGPLKAWYDISLPDYFEGFVKNRDLNGKICFQLTDEGLIIDIFDHEGNELETYARTAQEFADWML